MNDRPNPSELDELSKKIERAKGASASPISERTSGGKTASGDGMKMATELVVGVAVGAWIGYQLDQWLGTNPWLMVVFLFLGFGAGVWNVYRMAMRAQKDLTDNKK